MEEKKARAEYVKNSFFQNLDMLVGRGVDPMVASELSMELLGRMMEAFYDVPPNTLNEDPEFEMDFIPDEEVEDEG